MTNELEKRFFDTFNLTKYKLVSKYNKLLTYGPFDTLDDAKTVAKGLMDGFIIEEVYPQITDRILLELICLLNNYGCTSFAGNFEQLKNEVLSNSIMCCEDTDNDNYQQQVRTLFEEG